MMKRFLPILAVLAIMSLYSCTRSGDDSFYGPDNTRGYYPLTQGHFVLYDVDSTIWNDYDSSETKRHCQVRYTVTDTFHDNQDRLSYHVEVLSRTDENAPFKTNDVFFVTPTLTGLEVSQNNLRFLKLVFPVNNTSVWKGNSAIATADQDLVWYADWNYRYSGFGESYNNSRATFGNTVIVDEVDQTLNDPATSPRTYAERTYAREVYAHGVGLVYREMVRWTYDQNPANSTYARKGWGVVMRAVDHN